MGYGRPRRSEWRWFARGCAAAVLLSLVASGAVYGQGTPLAQAREFTHAQNYDPSLSPDGRRMVYVSVVAGREQLFIRSIDGHVAQQLTRDTVDHEDAAWSPDGTRLAFASNRNGPYQIFVMRADGTDVRLVARTTGRGTAPQWSRDGTIYFTICQTVDGGADCEIFTVAAPS